MQVSHKMVAGNTVYAFLRTLEPVLSPWLGHFGGVPTVSTILLSDSLNHKRNEKTFKISNSIFYLFIIIEGPHQLVSYVLLTCFTKYSYACGIF